MVAANSDWMGIATSAAQARALVAGNKLAVILSVEMDWLSPAQTLQLVTDYGVRQVIPVHPINNDVGGTALYLDAFNTVNAFVHATRDTSDWNKLGNDGWFHVEYDTHLTGRLTRPLTLIPITGNLIEGGAIAPTPIDDFSFTLLDYEEPLGSGGHKNAAGSRRPERRSSTTGPSGRSHRRGAHGRKDHRLGRPKPSRVTTTIP
jgi:hypothetical protein